MTWVTEPVASLNRFKNPYYNPDALGNEPAGDDVYADLALMVRIGKSGARTEVKPVVVQRLKDFSL